MVSYDVVILPSFAQVETWRKQRADERDAGLFAQVATTFDAWIADLWELHGDGRTIISDVQREIALQKELGNADVGFDASGVVSLAAFCMRKAAGVEAFEDALDAARSGRIPEGMSSREGDLLAALARYEESVSQMGYIEPGSAAQFLAQQGDRVFPRELRVLMLEAAPLTWQQGEFFATCCNIQLTVQLASGSNDVFSAPGGMDVRFAYPAGKLAEPGLVADTVVECRKLGDVIVACKEPLDMGRRVQERLSAMGFQVRIQARNLFSQTDFGRTYLSLYRCLHDNPWDPAALADVVYSPFLGFSQADAFKIDASLRIDRIVKRDDALATLRSASELFSQLEELATDPDADVLVGVFEQLVQSLARRSVAWKSEQLAALASLREVTAAARRFGMGIDACAAALARVSVPVSVCAVGDGPTVEFTTQALAARKGRGCVAALIATDLTAEDYPVADKDDAAATLLAKLGLFPEEDALTRARRQFGALCHVPAQRLVFMRPINDANAEPTYSSVTLEEYADTHGAKSERGEELLFANACAAEPTAVQRLAHEIAPPRIEDASMGHDAPTLGLRTLSPSQIEAYLECPYQWFATRRLRIEGLDEGFGPLEIGTFAHSALESFYRRFRQVGYAKVHEDNLAQARMLMNEIVTDLVHEQFSLDPGSGRLVPVTELERREVDALCNQLVAYLDFEARLLPTFHPAYLEYAIDADRPTEYASYPITGTIDRIDVDDNGHAVILDYKSSVNAEHEIAGKTPNHMGKVQTRIYAQVVKRVLGLNVVGALYVSYGRKPAVAGAYDPRVLDAAHLPGMKTDACACGLAEAGSADPVDGFSLADLTFDAMLDETERIAGNALSRMDALDVAPNPAYSKACAYCPVLACPKRGA